MTIELEGVQQQIRAGLVAEPMPQRLAPMMAEVSRIPIDDEAYGFEYKWDGVRAICYCSAGGIRIDSRNLLDITHRYPELADLGQAAGGHSLVLDGEIVALDEHLRPSFSLLQRRMHIEDRRQLPRLMQQVPVVYMLFDLLHIDGYSTRELEYRWRRQLLEQLSLQGPAWQCPPWQQGPGVGAAMVEAARANGLEGVVAKRLDSPYRPGARSASWLKIKLMQQQEFVVGGYLPGSGSAAGGIGSLLVGYYDRPGQGEASSPGKLNFAGGVGTGYSEANRRAWKRALDELAAIESPFKRNKLIPRQAVFCRPELVIQVQFFQWTPDGILRAPSCKGLRDDINPQDVVREEPQTF